jgi:hypothetical protein
MIVYHGCKLLYGDKFYCPIINYDLAKGKSIDQALNKAQTFLEDLITPIDKFMLQSALDDAQKTSFKSPFISTTPYRHIARSFALNRGTTGFIYTIEGPDDAFFDFNSVRIKNNFPPHKTFEWMNELGIPLELKLPFEIIQIEEISEIIEIAQVVYKK